MMWNFKGDTYMPDYDLVLWDFMGYIDPGDSAACFTTDQIANFDEMNWSNAEYDRLTEGQYREMDVAARMSCSSRGQAVMYAEQPMIVIDYPSVLRPSTSPVGTIGSRTWAAASGTTSSTARATSS